VGPIVGRRGIATIDLVFAFERAGLRERDVAPAAAQYGRQLVRLPVDADPKRGAVPFNADQDRECGRRRLAQSEQRQGYQAGDGERSEFLTPRSQPWRPPRRT